MAGPFKTLGTDTTDSEAVAYHDGFIYIFGSHFGKKSLDPDRAFTARFAEDACVSAGSAAALEIRKDEFRLHRAINDALASAGLTLLPISPSAADRFIEATRRRGERMGEEWATRIQAQDWPLNVEGAAFLPNDNLLLGLRSPVTATGHPILVELDIFVSASEWTQKTPRVESIWVLNDVGSSKHPVGVRDLDAGDETEPLSVIVGKLDGELLRKRDHDPTIPFAHWRTTLPASQSDARTRWEMVRDFESDIGRVEGVARLPDGRFIYASDEKRLVLRYDAANASAAST